MKRPWIRLYTDVPNNPKVQRLAGELFKFWINCLCLAGEDGALPPHEDIAYVLRLRPSEVRSRLEKLAEARLIEPSTDAPGSLQMHAWDERQFESDGSAARVRAYRERIKQAGRTPGAYTQHRAKITERDGSVCVYCGSNKSLCIDHVIPLIKGGDDHPDNLATACTKCNSGKSGRTPEEAGYAILGPYQVVHKRNIERLKSVTQVTVTETPPEQSRAEQIQSRTDPTPTPTPTRERDGEPWTVCGWTGPEEFESWWVDLVKRHPNRNRNTVARTRAIELVRDRLLIKSEFEAGYKAHQQANGERWTQDNGHFAPNLYSFMDDRMWKLTPIIAPKAPRTLGDIERERILRA